MEVTPYEENDDPEDYWDSSFFRQMRIPGLLIHGYIWYHFLVAGAGFVRLAWQFVLNVSVSFIHASIRLGSFLLTK